MNIIPILLFVIFLFVVFLGSGFYLARRDRQYHRSYQTMDAGPLRYAGFWPRLASLLLDTVVILPVVLLAFWGSSASRLFQVYYFIPSTLFGLFYSVYLVRRFGGTPGKLIVGIRIRKVDGEPVGYREAFLRYFPDFVFSVLMSLALSFACLHISDTDYHSLSFMERDKRLSELAPRWYNPLQWTSAAWFWGEVVVLLTNRKRRALHDFIAGTVVVHTSPSPNQSMQPTASPRTASPSDD